MAEHQTSAFGEDGRSHQQYVADGVNFFNRFLNAAASRTDPPPPAAAGVKAQTYKYFD